jgi:hypothetical protein
MYTRSWIDQKINILKENKDYLLLPLVFLFSRIILIISLPLDGLRSYGDIWNFFHLASLGVPFRDLWVEFPPVFPLINRLIYLLAGGKEHVFVYLISFFFSVVQAVNIGLFIVLAKQVIGSSTYQKRSVLYAFILSSLFYGWTYFDSLGVFCILISLLLTLRHEDYLAGLFIGIGGLVKMFPILLLPGIWKWRGPKAALRTVVLSITIIITVWGILFLTTPEMTRASLVSQYNKGSWESIWAIIDGNVRTGNFSPEADRTIPATADIQTGYPAVISPWVSLLIFGGVGLAIFLKSRLQDEGDLISFVAFTMILFYLWTPGYSPQWVLTLIPLILLSFGELRAVLICLIILMINLVEWPIILSRGWFHFLDEVVILRTVIYVFVAVIFGQDIMQSKNNPKRVDLDSK